MPFENTPKHLPVRVFQIPGDLAGQKIPIKISEPALRAENLSLETWASSEILSNLIHRLDDVNFPSNDAAISSTSMVPILELGAGTGLVGLSAAAIWKLPVVLTDLEPIIPGLAANIKLNEGILHGDARKATCGTLDWNKPAKLSIKEPSGEVLIPSTNKAHVILAADTVYSEEHPRLLSTVVLNWLSRDPDARFIITYAMRVAYLDEIRELWQLLEAGGLEAVDEGQDTATAALFDDECLCEWSVWKWRQD
ncbi:hypothetical protein MBLNU459_g8172t1 [Dothideomycetes sp. NU459]